jgi:hypothetical protein
MTSRFHASLPKAHNALGAAPDAVARTRDLSSCSCPVWGAVLTKLVRPKLKDLVSNLPVGDRSSLSALAALYFDQICRSPLFQLHKRCFNFVDTRAGSVIELMDLDVIDACVGAKIG